MKRRRNLLVVLLLVCAIGLGVGYASISGDLIINGAATLEDQPFAVAFTAYAAGTHTSVKTGNAVVDAIDANDPALGMTCVATGGGAISEATAPTQVTLTATGLQDVGDKVTGTLTIKNYNDIDMNLTITPSLTAIANYCDVTYTLPTTIAANGTAEFPVTIELKNIQGLWQEAGQVHTETRTFEFTLTIHATSVNNP